MCRKALFKEIKIEPSKWRNMPYSCMGWTIQHYKDAKLIYKLNTILVLTLIDFSTEN